MIKHPDDTVVILQRTIAYLEATLDRVRAALCEVQKPCAGSTIAEVRHADCISRNVPEGFDTVLGYLAKCHPEVLDLMDYHAPDVTARDGFWLAHRHKDVTYVPAPDVLRRKGIMRVRCWPVALLEQRFG